MFEGQEYPVCRVSISSLSHPLFVGGKQYIDAEGRVEKFKKKYQTAQQAVQEQDGQDGDKDSKEKDSKEEKKPALAKAKKKA